jgi:hypothetical protein
MSTDEYQLSAPAGKQTPRRNETQSYFFHHPSPFEGTLPFSLGMNLSTARPEVRALLKVHPEPYSFTPSLKTELPAAEWVKKTLGKS